MGGGNSSSRTPFSRAFGTPTCGEHSGSARNFGASDRQINAEIPKFLEGHGSISIIEILARLTLLLNAKTPTDNYDPAQQTLG